MKVLQGTAPLLQSMGENPNFPFPLSEWFIQTTDIRTQSRTGKRKAGGSRQNVSIFGGESIDEQEAVLLSKCIEVCANMFES